MVDLYTNYLRLSKPKVLNIKLTNGMSTNQAINMLFHAYNNHYREDKHLKYGRLSMRESALINMLIYKSDGVLLSNFYDITYKLFKLINSNELYCRFLYSLIMHDINLAYKSLSVSYKKYKYMCTQNSLSKIAEISDDKDVIMLCTNYEKIIGDLSFDLHKLT